MLAEVEGWRGLVRSGPAGPERRPGCLHCSPDSGTYSGTETVKEVQVKREKQKLSF